MKNNNDFKLNYFMNLDRRFHSRGGPKIVEGTVLNDRTFEETHRSEQSWWCWSSLLHFTFIPLPAITDLYRLSIKCLFLLFLVPLLLSFICLLFLISYFVLKTSLPFLVSSFSSHLLISLSHLISISTSPFSSFVSLSRSSSSFSYSYFFLSHIFLYFLLPSFLHPTFNFLPS